MFQMNSGSSDFDGSFDQPEKKNQDQHHTGKAQFLAHNCENKVGMSLRQIVLLFNRVA